MSEPAVETEDQELYAYREYLAPQDILWQSIAIELRADIYRATNWP